MITPRIKVHVRIVTKLGANDKKWVHFFRVSTFVIGAELGQNSDACFDALRDISDKNGPVYIIRGRRFDGHARE